MNWFKLLKNQSIPEFPKKIIYNESNFYNHFLKDLEQAREEVIIECPFITRRRVKLLKPTFEKLVKRGVKVFILTRDPKYHDELMAKQAEEVICYFEELGVQVLIPRGKTHGKLALIDRKIIYEGSLNILSYAEGWEIMWRIESKDWAGDAFKSLRYSNLDIFKRKLNLV